LRSAITSFSVILSFLICGIIVWILGANPFVGYSALIQGALGSIYNICISLNKAIPLIFVGLSVTLAFRGATYNIGAEGQLYFGALGAVLIGLNLNTFPIIHILLGLLAAFLGGFLWAFIPAILKFKLRINEVITTLLLNYVAIYFINFLVAGPISDHSGLFPQTSAVSLTSRLPIIIPKTRLHAGIIIVLLIALILYITLKMTIFGYKINVIGLAPDTAKYAGIKVHRSKMLILMISGGIAGIAGGVEILGRQFRLMDGFSPGWGYTGIAVALLGGLEPLGVLLAGIYFGILEAGANSMQRILMIPSAVVYIIESLAVVFVVIGSNLNIKYRSKKRK
jgi:ABC-type uncharacterized transport system permease subunit